MSSSKAKQIVFSSATNKAIAALKYEVFGNLPQLNAKTGSQHIKQMQRGHIIARYYPEPIEKSARKATPGYLTDQEQRRQEKLEMLRRKGKGPPKKGSGKRSQKK